MPVTSSDVARYAGVSRATVSYVINNGPRPVSEETRIRVQEAIRQLGYQPNGLARNLRLQRTSTLGLIVPDTHNSYFSEVGRGVERAAFENGYTVFLCHSGYSLDLELQYVDMLHLQRVAGVIWIPGTADHAPLHKLQEYEVDTVVVDRCLPNELAPSLTADNLHGGYLATRHLIELGHRRIGYISRAINLSHSQGRVDGYKMALAESGIAIDPNLLRKGGFNLQDGYRAMQELLSLDVPPTAVFAYNDIMAIGALRALHEAGLSVPDDFSVIGFDDIDAAAFTCPALTTIYLPKFDIGKKAADLLISLVEEKEVPAETQVTFDVKLIRRESTGPAPDHTFTSGSVEG